MDFAKRHPVNILGLTERELPRVVRAARPRKPPKDFILNTEKSEHSGVASPLPFVRSGFYSPRNSRMNTGWPLHKNTLTSKNLSDIFRFEPLFKHKKHYGHTKSVLNRTGPLSSKLQDTLVARSLQLVQWRGEDAITFRLLLLTKQGRVYIEEALRCDELMILLVQTHVPPNASMIYKSQGLEASAFVTTAMKIASKVCVLKVEEKQELLQSLSRLIQSEHVRLGLSVDAQQNPLHDENKLFEITNASGRQLVAKILIRKFSGLVNCLRGSVTAPMEEAAVETEAEALGMASGFDPTLISKNVSQKEKALQPLALKVRGQRTKAGWRGLRGVGGQYLAATGGDIYGAAAKVKDYLKLYQSAQVSQLDFEKLVAATGGQLPEVPKPDSTDKTSLSPPDGLVMRDARHKLALMQSYL